MREVGGWGEKGWQDSVPVCTQARCHPGAHTTDSDRPPLMQLIQAFIMG